MSLTSRFYLLNKALIAYIFKRNPNYIVFEFGTMAKLPSNNSAWLPLCNYNKVGGKIWPLIFTQYFANFTIILPK